MSKEDKGLDYKKELSHGERYKKRSDIMILVVGSLFLVAFLVMLFYFLSKDDGAAATRKAKQNEAQDAVFSGGADLFGNGNGDGTMLESFPPVDRIRGTLAGSPERILMSDVVLGNQYRGILTLTAKGTDKLRIISVDVADKENQDFSFENRCDDTVPLSSADTCSIRYEWKPSEAGSMQNNFTIKWRGFNEPAGRTVNGEYKDIYTQTLTLPISGRAFVSQIAIAPTADNPNPMGLGSESGCRPCCSDCSGSGKSLLPDLGADCEANPLNPGERVAFDKKGNPFGTVLVGGVVVDYDGNAIGAADDDGAIKNAEGTVVGFTTGQRLVVSEKTGSLLGTIKAGGVTVSNATGDEVGIVLGNSAVTDNNGKIIGYAVNKGKVFDDKGALIGTVRDDAFVINSYDKEIGKLRADGQVVSSSGGRIIGHVAPVGEIVVDINGNFVGRVNLNGEVINSEGLRLGALAAGNILYAENGNVLGGVATKGVAINAYGDVFGRTMSDGAVVGENCKVYGKVRADSNIVDYKGDVIGAVVPEGLAVSLSGDLIGRALINGSVVDGSGRGLGSIIMDGSVLNDEGARIGSVVSGLAVIDNDGKVIGHELSDGTFINNDNQKSGYSKTDGKVVSFNGDEIGSIVPLGYAVYSFAADEIGTVFPEGKVVNKNGGIIGQVVADYMVKNSGGTLIGYVRPYGDYTINEKGDYFGKVYVGDFVINKRGNVVAKLGEGEDSQTALNSHGRIIAFKVPEGAYVLSEEANDPVGRVIYDGRAYDKDGNLIGRVLPNGSVVDGNGDNVGHIVRVGIAYGLDGNQLGTILENGSVKDLNGNIVGKVLANGTIVDENGKLIGAISPGKVLKDSTGKIIGRLLPDGTLVNENGEIIGRLQPNGDIVDLNGNIIGRMLSNGELVAVENGKIGTIVKDIDGNVIGRLLPDGTIVDEEGNFFGKVMEDGTTVVDADNKVIGHLENGIFTPAIISTSDEGEQGSALYGGYKVGDKVYDENGNYLGILQADGTILNDQGKVVGRVLSNGIVVDNDNNIIGYRGDGQILRDDMGNIIGIVNPPTGEISGIDGKVFARLDKDGTIRDLNGRILYGPHRGRASIFKKVIEDAPKRKYGPKAKENEEDAGLSSAEIDTLEDFVPPSVFMPKDFVSISNKYDGRPRYTQDQINALYEARRVLEARRGELGDSIKILSTSQELKESIQQEYDAGASSEDKKKGWEGVTRYDSSAPVDQSLVIREDKAIPATIIRAVDTSHPVVVAAQVSRNIYGGSGRNIVIPAGSRLIGEVSGGGEDTYGSVTKVEFNFYRLIRPDGSAWRFQSETGGLGGMGGVPAHLNPQYWKRYGLPILGKLAANAFMWLVADDELPTTEASGDSVTIVQSPKEEAYDEMKDEFNADVHDVFEEIFEAAAALDPVIIVPAGTQITIYPKDGDLWLTKHENPLDRGPVNIDFSAKAEAAAGENAQRRDSQRGELEQMRQNRSYSNSREQGFDSGSNTSSNEEYSSSASPSAPPPPPGY
jgi:type IV secretory pathway VirB10-like protein